VQRTELKLFRASLAMLPCILVLEQINTNGENICFTGLDVLTVRVITGRSYLCPTLAMCCMQGSRHTGSEMSGNFSSNAVFYFT
jgi:hypothetical protein